MPVSLKPTIKAGRIVDHKKYICDTPEIVEELLKYKKTKSIFIFGEGGTHLLGWCLCDWRVGKISHVDVKKVKKVRKRGIYVVENAGDINDFPRPRDYVVVRTYRKGLHFGCIEFYPPEL